MTSPILRLPGVMRVTQLSKSTIYRLEHDAASGFPKRVRLSPDGKSVGWFEAEILEYLANRPRVAGTPAAPRCRRRGESNYLAKARRMRGTPEPHKG